MYTLRRVLRELHQKGGVQTQNRGRIRIQLDQPTVFFTGRLHRRVDGIGNSMQLGHFHV
jgi:hypothetical protein